MANVRAIVLLVFIAVWRLQFFRVLELKNRASRVLRVEYTEVWNSPIEVKERMKHTYIREQEEEETYLTHLGDKKLSK